MILPELELVDHRVSVSSGWSDQVLGPDWKLLKQ